MSSLLEVKPKILIAVLFTLFMFAIPILLLLLGVKFDATYYGLFIGFVLVVFFFLIYPKISKNKEFRAEMEENKKIAPIIRQNPEFYKIRRTGIIILGIIVVMSLALIIIGEWKYLQFIVPVIVFLFMMYYVRFLQKNPKTREYGQNLEQVEVTGFRTWLKIITIGTIIVIITIIIIFTWFFSFPD